MSTNYAFDLQKLYKNYFANSPYFVTEKGGETTATDEPGFSITDRNPNPRGLIKYSEKNIAFNKIGLYGQSIWFPVTFKTLIDDQGRVVPVEMEIEACTVAVNLSKTIINTPVSERKGTVKECFAIDDYRFTIKGFLIGKNRQVPESQIEMLKQIFESVEPVEMRGGYVELFLEDSCQVVVKTLDFPEVQGKGVWIRPFNMTLETDYIQDLIAP